MSIRIGSTDLTHGLMLAPMAGVSDYAFRRMCRLCGAEWTVSEMISAKALCYEQRSSGGIYKTALLARIRKDEANTALQLFGHEPEYMAQAAALLESGSYKGCVCECQPAAIDINMGCPVHKIVSNGEGSALMKNPDLAYDIVKAVSGALKFTPVTVKIRAGWADGEKNAAEIAIALERAGADMICVHGRTREQMYTPGAVDLDVIASVKQAVDIPVIGNGDIYSADDAIRMLSYTGCDGIMVARGAMGAPWIFSEISAALDGRTNKEITFEEKRAMMLEQLRLMTEDKGEFIAAAEAKKHVAWYTKGMKNSARLRDAVMRCENMSTLVSIVQSLEE